MTEYTVSEVGMHIQTLISKSLKGELLVIGEISNVKISKTHMYATLKDSGASLNLDLK